MRATTQVPWCVLSRGKCSSTFWIYGPVLPRDFNQCPHLGSQLTRRRSSGTSRPRACHLEACVSDFARARLFTLKQKVIASRFETWQHSRKFYGSSQNQRLRHFQRIWQKRDGWIGKCLFTILKHAQQSDALNVRPRNISSSLFRHSNATRLSAGWIFS